ncbi:thioredoxin family protein [Lentzea jiangxiensis]|uniref:Thioredoxin n=1 Tax=Lentzea jiangxiensis TaxID=641025 RepID=A0A1H0WI23_9PSEU|nr:thioredoxin domain-containing protein [Lentzea jiangxiensis]SDP90390.1 thioredoxin [Lentzea jiangxiensis]
MAVLVTDATFEQEVELSPVPVVVEFYATWCGNCRRIAPVLDELEAEFAPNVRLVKVNADENPQLVSKFAVASTPRLFAIVGGAQVATAVGAQPEPTLRAVFEAAATLMATEPGTGCGCGPSRGSATSAPAVGWVDAEACILPTTDQPIRLAEFDALFASSLRGLRREEPGWLRLHLAGGADVEAGARDLTAREAECCSFFDFTVSREGDEVIVDVRVPSDKEFVLDGLAAQAEAARA